MLFDPAAGAELDPEGNLLLWDALVQRNLARCDEYHVRSLDPQRSVRDVVQDLLDMVVRYAPNHPRAVRGVLLGELLTQAVARSPRRVDAPGNNRRPQP